MKKNICYFVSALVFFYSLYSYGQTERCGTHQPTRMVMTPQLLAKITTTINIPVVFHVLYKTDGTGNVSDAQIQAQLDSLNYGFGGSEFSFYTAAINRTRDNNYHYWIANINNNYSEDDSKAVVISNALDVDPAHVLNIFIGSGSYLYEIGQGQYVWKIVYGLTNKFPDEADESSKSHGVFVDYNTLPGGSCRFPTHSPVSRR